MSSIVHAADLRHAPHRWLRIISVVSSALLALAVSSCAPAAPAAPSPTAAATVAAAPATAVPASVASPKPSAAVVSASPAVASASPAAAAAASPSASSASSSSSSQAGLTTQARQLVQQATTGFVWAPAANGQIQPMDGWKGPTTPSPVPAGAKSVVAIAGCPGPCEFSSQIIKTEAEKFGWTVDIASATDGTPQSAASAMDGALAKHPDAIVGVGVQDIVVQGQLEKAKEQKIVTVGLGTSKLADTTWDANVDTRADVGHAIMAYWIIADSNGKASTVEFVPSEFVADKADYTIFKSILDQCAGCTTKSIEAPISDFFNPVAVNSKVTAALNADPTLSYIFFDGDFFQVGAGVQAAQTLNRKDVKFVAGGGGTVGLGLVQSGELAADAGVANEWVSYAALDQVRRGIAGMPYLGPLAWGGGNYLWTKENVGADPITNQSFNDHLAQVFDYRSQYHKLWTSP